MNEIIRRITMMIGIVAVGTILIFLDASIPVTLGATLAFGIIMAMGLGLLKPEDFKRKISSKEKSPKITDTSQKPKRTLFQKKQERETDKEQNKKQDKKGTKSGGLKQIFSRSDKKTSEKGNQKSSGNKGEKSKFSASLSATIASFQGTLKKTRDNKRTENIDSLLNSAIEEPVAPTENLIESEPESRISDSSTDFSDDFGSFDDEDFANLNSLEIDGEEISLDIDPNALDESRIPDNYDSDTVNMDEEINSILFAENAFDDEDVMVSVSLPENPDDTDLSKEPDTFDSDVFFVQGIEDGLDEESFIDIPETDADNQKSATLTDTLDELDNLPGFEKSYPDDEFSDFHSIDLEELDTNELSIETDEIIIEEEEEIDETEILPDDFIPSSDGVNTQNKNVQKNDASGSLFESTAQFATEIDTPISFSGKGEYDDILNVLESDIKKAKTGPEPSLVRDMKDVHVEAKDLAEELETVLNLMGGKSSKPDDTDTRRKR